MTKVVDTREYLNVLRELTEEGKEVSLLITGSSMSPFLIHGRDYVYFRKPDRDLKKGDIVFFQRDSGQYDLRPDLLCQKKGQKNPAGRFLVGIFCPCVDSFSASPPVDHIHLWLFPADAQIKGYILYTFPAGDQPATVRTGSEKGTSRQQGQ